MALTFRTGSGGKGSALTIDELDNNFRHFTGSHDITGSLTISGSCDITGSLVVSGSIITTEDVILTGSFTGSFDGDLTGSFDGDLTGSFTGSGDGSFTGSFNGTFSGSIDGTEFYINNLSTTEPTGSGRLWLSGSAENSKYLMVRD
jgi:hypothetical protein